MYTTLGGTGSFSEDMLEINYLGNRRPKCLRHRTGSLSRALTREFEERRSQLSEFRHKNASGLTRLCN